MLIKMMKPDFKFENDCGVLTQLVRNGWQQINVIYSVANCVRGGHYHKYNIEAFYVIKGCFKLNVYNNSQIEEYDFSTNDMFQILPNTRHTFTYYTDTYLIAMYDKGVELSETEKDIWIDKK